MSESVVTFLEREFINETVVYMEDFDFAGNEEAISFILKKMKKDKYENIPSKEVLDYVLDRIFDFYESKGFLDENSDDEVEFSVMDMVTYIKDKAEEDGFQSELNEEMIETIVDYNFDYEDSVSE